MIPRILQSAFPKTCVSQMIMYNRVMESKKDYENVFKIYKYIVMRKL